MYNVMKAQLYQLKHDNLTYYLLAAVIFLSVMIIYTSAGEKGFSGITGSSWFSDIGGMFSQIVSFVTIIITARICGFDLRDGTLNYELLTGTERRKVYYGRTLISFIVSCVVFYGYMLITTLIFTIPNGWGHTVSFGHAMKSMALLLFPMMRLTAFYSLAAFIAKDDRGVIALGYLITELGTMFQMFTILLIPDWAEAFIRYIFPPATIEYLVDVSNMTLDFFDGEDIRVVKTMLNAGDAAKMCAVSAAMAVLYLIIANNVFLKKDLK